MPFTRMDAATPGDWQPIIDDKLGTPLRNATRLVDMLAAQEGVDDGHAVDQLTHSLQTATRAERAGADDELVLGALCHDVARGFFSDENHAEVAAAMLRPFVRPEVAWVVAVHSDFTAVYFTPDPKPKARRRHRLRRGYRLARRFADEWDQTSFDPAYETLPLEHFAPIVERLVTPIGRYL